MGTDSDNNLLSQVSPRKATYFEKETAIFHCKSTDPMLSLLWIKNEIKVTEIDEVLKFSKS